MSSLGSMGFLASMVSMVSMPPRKWPDLLKVRMAILNMISYEGFSRSLEKLEGKTRKSLLHIFLCKITVCLRSNLLYRCNSMYIYILKMCKKTLVISMNQSLWFHGY